MPEQKKKIFISIPMQGKSDEQIKEEMNRIMYHFPTYELLDTVVDSGSPMACIGRSIQLMAEADLIVFAPGWSRARGCLTEKYIADRYGKTSQCIFLSDRIDEMVRTANSVKELTDALILYPQDWDAYCGEFHSLKITPYKYMNSIDIEENKK